MSPDVFNGFFEFAGSIMLWANVRQLYKDKVLKGISMWPTLFFTSWGVWNAVLYYPSLHQWFSFSGGLMLLTAQFVWLGQMFYYRRKNAH